MTYSLEDASKEAMHKAFGKSAQMDWPTIEESRFPMSKEAPFLIIDIKLPVPVYMVPDAQLRTTWETQINYVKGMRSNGLLNANPSWEYAALRLLYNEMMERFGHLPEEKKELELEYALAFRDEPDDPAEDDSGLGFSW